MILALSALAMASKAKNALDIGNSFMSLGMDGIINGGFWIWDIGTKYEFYSDNFRKSLGFENEDDFPNTADSWQKQIYEGDKIIALENFAKHKDDPVNEAYHQKVRYYRKDGTTIELICSGIIVEFENGDKYLIGSHELI